MNTPEDLSKQYRRKFRDEDMAQDALLGWLNATRQGLDGYAAYRNGIWHAWGVKRAESRLKRGGGRTDTGTDIEPTFGAVQDQQPDALELHRRICEEISRLPPSQLRALRVSIEGGDKPKGYKPALRIARRKIKERI